MASHPITLCDGYDFDFVTVTGQILMAVHSGTSVGQRDRPGAARDAELLTDAARMLRRPTHAPVHRA